jgi:glyoxylase-like metal-dependent hydrolase (beta-lactamase superfamily II)
LAPDADVTVTAGPARGGLNTDIIVLREVGRPPVRLQVDAATGLLIAVEVVEEHSPRGDALVRITFSDFRAADQLVLPYQLDISVDGLGVHSETRSSIRVAEEADEALFAVEDSEVREGSLEQQAFAHYSTEWIMSYVLAGVQFYFDLQTAPATSEPVDIADGVKLVIGPSHNTLVVELPDRLLAVEAPLYDDYSRAALAQVKAAFPGKPLRELVGTHFHYDHIGGIREFAADGDLTVHVGSATVPFFEEILRSPHTVDPDRLAHHPVEAKVEGIDESLVFPTANGGTVEIYHITSDHSEDMLIVYVSSGKLVFNSDLWNPTPHMPAPGDQRGRLATQLYDAIISLGLDVETIVGGHLGSDGKTLAHSAPLAHLKNAAGR